MAIYYSSESLQRAYQGSNLLGAMYVDSYQVNPGSSFISASGGTVTFDGDYAIHTFSSTGSSNFTVYQLGINNTIEYFILAGGGGGSKGQSGQELGAGGAGGTVRTGSYTISLPLTYPVIVGAGGAIQLNLDQNGNNGGNSSVFSVTAAGGGGGIYTGDGGSNADYSGGTDGAGAATGGGAGAGQNGASGDTTSNGGNGTLWSGSYYGGGGAGMCNFGCYGTGGLGGGANAFLFFGLSGSNGLGGGGGGIQGTGDADQYGGAGGSGLVVLKYQYK
jgi:hypothetical protein